MVSCFFCRSITVTVICYENFFIANSLICLAQYKVYIMVYDFRDFFVSAQFQAGSHMGLSIPVNPGLKRSSQTSGAHHSHQCSSLHSGHVSCAEGLVEEDWKEVLVRHSERVLLRSTVSVWLSVLSLFLFCWVKPVFGWFHFVDQLFQPASDYLPWVPEVFLSLFGRRYERRKKLRGSRKALILFFRGLLPGATFYQPKTSGKVSMKKPAWTVSPETGWESCLDPMHLVTRRGREGVFFFGKLFDDSSYTHYDINCRRNRAVNSYVSSLNSLNIINPFSPSALFP